MSGADERPVNPEPSDDELRELIDSRDPDPDEEIEDEQEAAEEQDPKLGGMGGEAPTS